jgi:GGDEF domain-containing protein
MIVVIGFLASASFIFSRYRLRLLSLAANWWLSLRRNAPVLGERLLVVGDGEARRLSTWLLNRPMFRRAFSIVGFISDKDPTKNGMKINGYWMLGGTADIHAIIKHRDIGVILSAIPLTARETTEYIYDVCQDNNIRLIFLKDLLVMIDQQINQPEKDYGYPVWLDNRLASRAMYNAVTGLPTRYLFQDRLKQSLAYASEYKSRLAVAIIKIEISSKDTGGTGGNIDDQLLVEVARQLAKCKKESDTLAYIGNNRFAMILESMTDGIPDSIANKIRELLSEPIKIEQFVVQILANIEIKESKDYNLDELATFSMTEIEDIKDKEKRLEVLN